MLNYNSLKSMECLSHEMFKVSSSLVHARPQTLVKAINSPCLYLASEEGRFRFSAVFFKAYTP